MKKENSKKQHNQYSTTAMATGVVILLLFVSEFFFYTWCRVQCVSLRYDIQDENETSASLEAQQKGLKIELTRLKSPVRIINIARQQGLIMPRADQIMVIP